MSESSSYRSPVCKHASNSRKLVVCIDGTSNKPGDKNTNVIKFYDKVDLGDSGPEPQKYYLKGIGAYDPDQSGWPRRKYKEIRSGLEQAFARNADKNIKKAYRWLTEHYREGDRIYLFGFSRGGFQVRALASIIHEVGLAKDKANTESAYDHYQDIDPYDSRTRIQATEFKNVHCWDGVRIHFVGVWDTVSSLGFIKKEVHITASASVTNACHFRHALALDERRVKFIPEYFLEMNAHRKKIKSAGPAVGDVKEVWFAGCHSDVGGTERPLPNQLNAYWEEHVVASHAVHAGNVPLLWMRHEASNKGLVFEPLEFAWGPEDIDFGTTNSMSLGWGATEILPIRHEVSFSGTGEHKRRFHWFRPRSVLPDQQIHASVLSGYMYTPQATWGNAICVPTVQRNRPEGSWMAELPDDEVTTWLSSLLSDQYKTLRCLGKVSFLLDFKLGKTQPVPQSRWSEVDIQVPGRSDFAKFGLTVVYDVTSGFAVSAGPVTSATASLSTVLSNPDHPGFHETLKALRFLTRHHMFRQRFCNDEMIGALVRTLEWAAMSRTEHLLPLVTESLCNLIRDNDLRRKVVEQPFFINGMLSVALESRSCNKLVALLKLIATLYKALSNTPRRSSGSTTYSASFSSGVERTILELVQRDNPAGPAAVEALIALHAPHSIHISNVLGYLCNTLPQLDAEGGSTASAENIDVPSVLQIGYSGPLNRKVVGKVVSIIESCDPCERTVATLTIVKLCRNDTIREYCKNKVLNVFIRQLGKKETALLAAYALNTCLNYNMWSPTGDFSHVATLIVTMLDKGWFDDAVGQVEGYEILRGLMASGNLRQRVNTPKTLATLVKKLEVGERHEVRMSLLYLDIIETEEPLDLEEIVLESIGRLEGEGRKVQMKGVKVLAALALTVAGERAIKSHLAKIVQMPLPSQGEPLPDRLFGLIAVLYDLSKNETLREEIQRSAGFRNLRSLRRP